MSDTTDTFSNDATSKLLGYDYQKLVALEMCLNAKKNEHIWIECKGDVATEDTSVEVKHHGSAHNLTSNSEDVWKTVKNYVIEKSVVKGFSHLVLHTTSTTSSNSIFHGWNDLTAAKKRAALLKHTPSKTIEKYHATIKACPASDLKDILGKFRIQTGQSTIEQKWEQIKQHPALIQTPDNFRDEAIKWLYGYITKAAIDNQEKWQIPINDFHRDIQNYLSRFSTGKTPFPSTPAHDVDTTNQSFVFVERLNEINLKPAAIENAVADYLRAQVSQLALLRMTPTLEAELRDYDDSVFRDMVNEKLLHANSVEKDEIDTEEGHKKSRDLYLGCRRLPYGQIAGIDGLQKYYRDGRIEHHVETKPFEWKFGKEDV